MTASNYVLPHQRTYHEQQSMIKEPSPRIAWTANIAEHDFEHNGMGSRFATNDYDPNVYSPHELWHHQHIPNRDHGEYFDYAPHQYDYENPRKTDQDTAVLSASPAHAEILEDQWYSPVVNTKASLEQSLNSWEPAGTPPHYNSRSCGDIKEHCRLPYYPTRSVPAGQNIPPLSYTNYSSSLFSGILPSAAHQAVPLAQQSTYSELAVNLEFMDRLEREERDEKRQRQIPSRPPVSTAATVSSKPPPEAESPGSWCMTDSATYQDKRFSSGSPRPESPGLWIPTQLTFVNSNQPVPKPVSAASSPGASVASSRLAKEPKKMNLACTFCKERKIACGRPPEGSADPTCNQCERRSFVCKYDNRASRQPRPRRRYPPLRSA